MIFLSKSDENSYHERVRKARNYLKEGKLYESMNLCKLLIREYGKEICQEPLWFLALIWYAQKDYIRALHYCNQTQADPINRLDLIDKLENKLGI